MAQDFKSPRIQANPIPTRFLKYCIMKKQVVLLPALLCTKEIFINQIHALQDVADFHTPDLGTTDSVEEQAYDILKTLPETFCLCGISMGGYVAFEILRQAPERVSNLLLLDTTALPDNPEKEQSRLDIMQKARTHGIQSVVPDVLASVVAPAYRSLPQLLRFMEFMAQTIGTERFCNQEKIIMSRPDSTPDLPSIRCPAIVAAGALDNTTPPETMRFWAQKIPQAQFDIIPDCGHLSVLENPQPATALFKRWLCNM